MTQPAKVPNAFTLGYGPREPSKPPKKVNKRSGLPVSIGTKKQKVLRPDELAARKLALALESKV